MPLRSIAPSTLFTRTRSNLRALRRGDRGNLTVLMGLSMLAVALAAGIAVDTGRLLNTKTALAAAADTAALQVANSDLNDQSAMQALAEITLLRNFDTARHGELESLDVSAADNAVTLTARIAFKTSFMRLAGVETISLPAQTEVIKSGNNIEVALVLDTTGSMRGSKLRALKSAAEDFVQTVVWDNQSRFYSKLAVVPYSMGVNLGARASEARGPVSAGTCTTPGCASYRFRNMDRQNRTFNISSCVSERTGAEAYTDAPPSAAPVGRNYASPDNPCLDSELLPLTTSKSDILDVIDRLVATGSTAGHIGIAWGWYVLSREFGLWSGGSLPSDYNTPKVRKIAVIMTDGAFNTAHCNGVVARNSGAGSGARDDKINCDAPNGASKPQAIRLCTEMKARGISIYTIGFDVEDDSEAQDVMQQCASGEDHAYLAATADELDAAFRDIGKKVTALRIAR